MKVAQRFRGKERREKKRPVQFGGINVIYICLECASKRECLWCYTSSETEEEEFGAERHAMRTMRMW